MSEIRHGVDCPKRPHLQNLGHLHDESDDGPYDVDGCVYCGRCHVYIGGLSCEVGARPRILRRARKREDRAALEPTITITEHNLYLLLIGPLERHMGLDPCPAMKVAGSVATDVFEEWQKSREARDGR